MRKHHVLAEALESRRLFAGGGLDATYALTGRLPIGFGNQFDSASAIIRQTDGKFVVGGLTSSNTTGLSSFALARINPDGTLDTGFGNSGRVTTSFGGSTSAQIAGLAQLNTGKILAIGLVSSGSTSDVALARYNADGTLDTSFATNGFTTVNTGATNEIVNAAVVDSSNNVYVAGNAGNNLFVARITPAGVLDTTYGTSNSGVFTSPGPSGSATASLQSLVLDTSGRLVAGGFRGVANGTNAALSDFLVARFTTAGAPDTTFNSNGYYVTDFAGQNQPDEALGVALQTDGRILAAGFTGNTLPRSGQARFAVLRLSTDGTLDPNFATAGKFTSAPANARYQSLDAIGVLPDNRIVAVGVDGDPAAPAATPDAINANFAAIRLSSAGALDTTFGTNGLATADISGNFDEARAFVVLPDGRLTLAGLSGNPSDVGGGSDFATAQLTSDTTATTNNVSIFAPTSVSQGQPATFTVNLSQPATSPITLNYTTTAGTAAAGTDFTTTSGTLTFNTGEQSKTVQVPTLVNAANTAGRAFALTLSAAGGPAISFVNSVANVSILGTSQNATLPTIGVQNTSATEPTSGATGAAVFTVTLDNPSTLPVTIRYATADVSARAGTDYTASTGTVTIPAGSTTASISVPLLSNTSSVANSSFVVNLSSPTNAQIGTTNQGIATIIDSTGAPTVTIAPSVSANSRLTGRGGVPFTVTLSRAASAPVTVIYSTANGSALAGTDYVGVTAGTLTIPTGSTTATINVTSLGSLATPGTNTFTLTLNSATNATLAGTSAATASLVHPAFHTVAFTGNNRIAFTDADNQRVTVTLSRDAAGYLVFQGTSPATGAVRNVLQEARDADSIVLTNSTSRTSLTVTAAGRGNGTTLSAIAFSTPVSRITATTTDILGDVGSTNAPLGTLAVRSLSNANVLSAGGTTTSVTVAQNITNSNIVTASPLRTLSAGGNISNSTVSAGGDITSLSARSAVSALSITTPAQLRTLSAGSLADTTVAATGNVGTVTSRNAATGVTITTPASVRTFSATSIANTVIDAALDLTSVVTRGAITNSTFRAGRLLNSLSALSLTDSRVLAGVPAATNLFPNLGDTNYFSGLTTSRINSISLRGSSTQPAFSNSLVIAPTVNSANLGRVAIGAAPVTQGLFADTINSASYRDPAQPRNTAFRRLTQGDNPTGNFTVRAI